jgi:DNA-binding CsgD family transcriptional regulator
MPDLLLTATDQGALRALVAAGPVAGMPPAQKVLENVAILIPCDALTVGIADASGCLVDCVCLPAGTHAWGLRVNERPHPVGIVHMSLDPEDRDRLAAHGLTDALVICFRNGTKYVAWLSLDRCKQPFSERDISVLRMIAPALERLLRNQPSRALPATLTVQERKVLQLVAMGLSNTEIADRLYVVPSTVRKHLEHAFRKLGVTNRLAAVVAFEGRRKIDSEWVEPIETFASKRIARARSID